MMSVLLHPMVVGHFEMSFDLGFTRLPPQRFNRILPVTFLVQWKDLKDWCLLGQEAAKLSCGQFFASANGEVRPH